jgi:hypothetical protein
MRLKRVLFSIIISMAFFRVNAQTDSIYSISGAINNGRLNANFFSTYTINDLTEVHIDVYDSTGTYLAGYNILKRTDNTLFSKTGNSTTELQSGGILKFNIDEVLFDAIKNKPLRFYFYINGIKANTGFKSNTLFHSL